MLCLQCGRLAVPDTRWGGSDFAEFAAWSLWSVAAWLYCFWRHLGREKSCAHCGSRELMRETQAARRGHALASKVRLELVAPLASPSHRLQAFRGQPRKRLRVGALAVLLGTLTASAGALGLFGTLGTAELIAYSQLASLSALVGFELLCLRGGRRGAKLERCRAWDERGRKLRIEAL